MRQREHLTYIEDNFSVQRRGETILVVAENILTRSSLQLALQVHEL